MLFSSIVNSHQKPDMGMKIEDKRDFRLELSVFDWGHWSATTVLCIQEVGEHRGERPRFAATD